MASYHGRPPSRASEPALQTPPREGQGEPAANKAQPTDGGDGSRPPEPVWAEKPRVDGAAEHDDAGREQGRGEGM